MKKLAVAFGALVIILSSCSSGDEKVNEPSTSSSILVKKAIVEDEDGDYTALYTYSGNKIVKSTNSDGTSEVYTYTGDLITKVEFYNDTALEYKETFSYNSENKLISYTELSYDGDWGTKEVYVYNSDGTISLSSYDGDLTSQTELNKTGKIFFANGEVNKFDLFQNGIKTRTTNYTYDTKNNAYKNITGFDKIAFTGEESRGISHNILKETNTDTGGFTYQYTYNSNDYPSTQKETESGTVYTTQYFYE